MTERTAKVWDKDVPVSVHQKSKSVWVAVGTYHGQRIEAKGRSESAALALWRETARYRGG
ncbi:hypothetical protein GCM10010994_60570 [Chelatococcus reniformis]|uniref:Uncharacterized protein n=1 Tax=Chelatococcus reniformis TaxID=1494448 RepID=A0A916V0L1_9HYPH|nr:hypothetical protein GCM10010994_60570 [Chelatococcus reniformis]